MKIVSSELIGTGMNNPELVTFEDGSKGVWKGYTGKDSIAEVATYELAKEIGLNDLVPQTEFYLDRPGTVQKFVPNAKTGSELWPSELEKTIQSPQGLRVGVLDYITGNIDRHDGNVLVGRSGKLSAIDNGMSFNTDGTNSAFYRAHKGEQIPSNVRNKLRNLDRSTIDSYFSNMRYSAMDTRVAEQNYGKPPKEAYADAMWSRIQTLADTGKLPKIQ